MRRARKVDANLSAIVEIARKVGFLVHVTNADWDATVQFHGLVEMWECKADKKLYGKNAQTKTQKKLKDLGWKIRTVRTAEDVMKARAEMLCRAGF